LGSSKASKNMVLRENGGKGKKELPLIWPVLRWERGKKGEERWNFRMKWETGNRRVKKNNAANVHY